VSADGSRLTPTAVRRGVVAALSLCACLAAPVAWALSMDVPWMRSSGAAAWLLLAVGVGCGLLAARADRRLRVRVLAGLDLVVAALFTWFFFGWATLPVTPAEELRRAPDFTLPDVGGRPVTLSQRLAGGPILLVFYRGHW